MEMKKTGTPYLAALLLVLLPAFLLSSCKETKTSSLSQHPCSPDRAWIHPQSVRPQMAFFKGKAKKDGAG